MSWSANTPDPPRKERCQCEFIAIGFGFSVGINEFRRFYRITIGTINVTCMAGQNISEQTRISEHQMLQHKVITMARDATWNLAVRRRFDPLGIGTPVPEEFFSVRLEAGEKEYFKDCFPSAVQRAFDPRVPHTEGLAGEVETPVCGGGVEACVQGFKFSGPEEGVGAFVGV